MAIEKGLYAAPLGIADINNDEVPEQHKNYENIVLDDDTQLPVLEVEITDMGSLLTGIPKGIYREWEYDDSMEQYRKTSYIERI